ncbi:MAG: hypothetical protein CMH75_04815 [Nitrospina sp.]|nr:hypothetical protein [Nitrospina sp.]|tara:strand:+ start:2050 stop:2565 length:516 start_codon:yes stop_codon:yes gene_type:complete
MIKTVREFRVWRAQFCFSPKGKIAMDQMKKLQQGKNEFPYGNLESSVLQACFQAFKFEIDKNELDSRRRIAGMQFSKLSAKKFGRRKLPNIARNSMILYLTTFFRFYTANKSTYEFVGKKVPNFGEDKPDVVARFVNAIFRKENLNGASIRRITRRLNNEGVRLAHWKFSQ